MHGSHDPSDSVGGPSLLLAEAERPLAVGSPKIVVLVETGSVRGQVEILESRWAEVGNKTDQQQGKDVIAYSGSRREHRTGTNTGHKREEEGDEKQVAGRVHRLDDI